MFNSNNSNKRIILIIIFDDKNFFFLLLFFNLLVDWLIILHRLHALNQYCRFYVIVQIELTFDRSNLTTWRILNDEISGWYSVTGFSYLCTLHVYSKHVRRVLNFIGIKFQTWNSIYWDESFYWEILICRKY